MDNLIHLLVKLVLPHDCGVEIVGFVGPFLGPQRQHTNHIADHDLQMLPILFIHGKQESGEHGKDHEQGGGGTAQRLLCEKVQRDAKERSGAEADELPFGQVKQHLGFDFC